MGGGAGEHRNYGQRSGSRRPHGHAFRQ
jgi:hypothetical protein